MPRKACVAPGAKGCLEGNIKWRRGYDDLTKVRRLSLQWHALSSVYAYPFKCVFGASCCGSIFPMSVSASMYMRLDQVTFCSISSADEKLRPSIQRRILSIIYVYAVIY